MGRRLLPPCFKSVFFDIYIVYLTEINLPSKKFVVASQFESVDRVLLNSKASETFFNAVVDTFEQTEVENLTAGSFNSYSAKSDLVNVGVLADALVDAQIAWDTNADCDVSIGCVGALLTRIRDPLKISADIALDSQMMVTQDTLRGLQVFSKESHPSLMSDGSKESMCLYSVLNNTCTPMGARLLGNWLRKPLTSIQNINKRLDMIQHLIDHKNMFKELQTLLKRCKSLYFMSRSHKWSLAEWKSVFQLFFAINGLNQLHGDLFPESDTDEGENCFKRLVRLYGLEFINLGNEISQTIDFEASGFEGRCVVNYGIDSELDEWKRQYDNLDMLLNQVALRMKPSFMDALQEELRIVYFPQIGFLVAFPVTLVEQYSTAIPADYQQLFVSDMMTFFKCDAMTELDTSIGDIHHIIVDKEIEILYGLQVQISEYKSTILEMSETIAEIDTFVSLAVCSDAYSYCRPQLTETSQLEIVDGRHPLLERNTQFICNNCSLDDDKRLIIITGPNASGKSIYLKQIGLIAFMAQIGCFVPAQSATIGIFDGIFSRISTHETLEKNASSFLIDLRQMYVATKYATAKSLVLIDEFGKGTNLADGIGLMSSILNFFTANGDSPRIIMTTHYHDLVSTDDYLADQVRQVMKPQQMQIYTDNNREDEVVFLYKVVDGVCENSLGCYLARMVGMPYGIVQRAETISRRLIDRQPIEPKESLIAHADKVNEVVEKVKLIELTAEHVREFLQTRFGL